MILKFCLAQTDKGCGEIVQTALANKNVHLHL